MLVRCRTGPSPLNGLGVFAEEPIAASQPVWRLDPELDRLIAPVAISTLPGAQQEFLNRYAYRDHQRDQLVLCGDDARFMNHSPTPNVSEVRDAACVALHDIAAGEELTCDYHQLDPRPMRFQPQG